MESLLKPKIQSASIISENAGQDTFVLWLTGLKYLEEKKAMLAEFSCSAGLKRAFSFAFFPSLIVSKKSVSKDSLKEETAQIGRQKFEAIEQEHCFKVVSANFSLLKNLEESLFSKNITAINPAPERQFLIEKKWGFFDAFEFDSNAGENLPVKKHSFDLPDIKTDFFAEPLPETIKALAKIDLQEAKKILSLVSLSKLLLLPLEKIPVSSFACQEIFLENLLFRNNFVPEKTQKSKSAKFPNAMQNSSEEEIAGIGNSLMTAAFYNIGFESIDCACCEPESAKAQNLLPNSTVEAEFLKDAFYFESIDAGFSFFFNESHGLRQNRERIKKEFFLNQFPIGPFSRNQTEEILLADAVILEKNREAKIIGFREKHWFCLKESFLSKAIKALDKEALEAASFLEKTQAQCLSGKGIMGLVAVEKDFSWQLALEHKKNLELFLASIPRHLASEESRFFNGLIADSLEKARSALASSLVSSKPRE